MGVAVNRLVYFVHASIVDWVVMDRCGQQHRAGAPWSPPLLPVVSLPVRYGHEKLSRLAQAWVGWHGRHLEWTMLRLAIKTAGTGVQPRGCHPGKGGVQGTRTGAPELARVGVERKTGMPSVTGHGARRTPSECECQCTSAEQPPPKAPGVGAGGGLYGGNFTE